MICFGVYYKTGRVDNKFFIKNEETLNFTRETPRGGP